MKQTKIEIEAARIAIIQQTKVSDNTIAFFFNEDGSAQVITATNDEIYDKMALSIAGVLEKLSETIEK